MKIETFFEKFDEFIGVPNAVPRMRRFILDLAVTGKLVIQDPNDESAAELLKQVQAEKTRLVKAGEIRNQAALPPVIKGAISFPLPPGWAATQLGDVAACLDYMREPINGTERDLRITGKDQSALFPYYGATQQQGWIDDYIFDEELVLLGEDGVPFFDDLRAKAYLISGKSWVNNHAHVFRCILISNPFLKHCLNTLDYTGRVAGSTRSKLNQAKALDIPIALPPLAEQKRIVTKVDELMALCDRLEAQLQERDTQQAALARAVLARFAEEPTLANLELLFHDSFNIEPADLRKTILSLAIRGKLVAQDPSDEPAEETLVRLKLKSTATSMHDSRADDSIPSSWTRVRFEDVAVVAGGVTLGRKLGKRKTITLPYLRVANVKRGELDLGVIKQVAIAEDEIERYRLRNNDLLMTEGGDWDKVGRAAIWHEEIPVCLHQNHVFRVRMRSDKISPLWVERFFNSPDGRSYFESASKQTNNQPRVHQHAAGQKLPSTIPPTRGTAQDRRQSRSANDLGWPVGGAARNFQGNCHESR
jgi:type I restriction enzyme S subunit